MKVKKTSLTDPLVKAMAWAYNTSVNNLGYSPLQLVTDKAFTIPGLTAGNEATESLPDSEAVQLTLEEITKIIEMIQTFPSRQCCTTCMMFYILMFCGMILLW